MYNSHLYSHTFAILFVKQIQIVETSNQQAMDLSTTNDEYSNVTAAKETEVQTLISYSIVLVIIPKERPLQERTRTPLEKARPHFRTSAWWLSSRLAFGVSLYAYEYLSVMAWDGWFSMLSVHDYDSGLRVLHLATPTLYSVLRTSYIWWSMRIAHYARAGNVVKAGHQGPPGPPGPHGPSVTLYGVLCI